MYRVHTTYLLSWQLISDLNLEQSSMPQICFQVWTPISNRAALQTNRVGLHEEAKGRPFPSSLSCLLPPSRGRGVMFGDITRSVEQLTLQLTQPAMLEPENNNTLMTRDWQANPWN